jgi:hypothetical protein
MYNGIRFAGPYGAVSTSLSAAVSSLTILLTQIDFALLGSFGVGAIKDNLQAQLSAAQSFSVDLLANMVNPVASYQSVLVSLQQLQATILAALATGTTPMVSLQVTQSVSASIQLSTQLKAQISALDAIIQGGINAKAPATKIVSKVQGALSSGPIFVISWDNITLSDAGSKLFADFSSGLASGLATIGAADQVYGVLLVTKSPTAWAALQATMLT